MENRQPVTQDAKIEVVSQAQIVEVGVASQITLGGYGEKWEVGRRGEFTEA
jgi:hypothetical protein